MQCNFSFFYKKKLPFYQDVFFFFIFEAGCFVESVFDENKKMTFFMYFFQKKNEKFYCITFLNGL